MRSSPRPAHPTLDAAAAVWLLHHGASVAAQKEDGWKDTALHYSAGRGSLETVHALLAWGADPAAANALGRCKEIAKLRNSSHKTLHFEVTHLACTNEPEQPAPNLAPVPRTAGATPADVAEKAGHLAVAQLLQAAAEGHPPEGLPSREELVQRYLSSSDKLAAAAAGSGGAGATQLGARAGSLQLAAAELGDASVQVQTVAGRHVSAALDKVLESPTTSEGQGSSSSSAGKSEQSASLPGPAAAAGDAAAQQKPTSAALAAARQLARRGFEGLGSPGERASPLAAVVCARCWRGRKVSHHGTCLCCPAWCRHGASGGGAALPAPCGADTGMCQWAGGCLCRCLLRCITHTRIWVFSYVCLVV